MEESDIDFKEEKWSLKRDVIDYGNDMEYDIKRVSQSGSEDVNNSYSSGSSQEMEIDTRINEKQTDPIEESKKANHRQIRAKKSRSFFEYVPQPKRFLKCL